MGIRIEGETLVVEDVPMSDRPKLENVRATLPEFGIHPGNIRIETRGVTNQTLELVARLIYTDTGSTDRLEAHIRRLMGWPQPQG